MTKSKSQNEPVAKKNEKHNYVIMFLHNVWKKICEKKPLSLSEILALLLTLITFFYLLETRNQRLLLEQTVAVDTQPKVFIKTIETKATPDFPNSRILIHTKLVLSNCGKSEARRIQWSYVVSQGDQVKKKGKFGPFQYLFPNQTATASIENLRFTLPPDEMEIVKKAVELDRPIVISGNLQKPVLLDIELIYEKPDGESIIIPYRYRYIFPMNAWVFPSDKDD